MSGIPRQYAELFRTRGFDLRERIGFGASGTVFRAHQSSVDRDVAIKVFDPPATTSEAMRARFQREAKLLARVSHPSIPVVLTAGSIATTGATGATPYFVMQYIPGETLGAVIKRQRSLPLATAVSCGTELLGALSAAHHARIVHRDVKPQNIIVGTSGHCHLIDFSIGVNLNAEPGFTRLTTDGRQQPGTFDYMAPEAQSTTEADPRADIYSLGVVLFEMLAGHPRISVDTLDDDLSRLPVAARDFLRTACARDPEARYQDAEAAGRALAGLSASPRDRSGSGSALCKNVRCPKAQWTPQGYYEGPRVMESTSDSFCDACGEKLAYPCDRCGRPYADSQFCGGCGARWYELPVCQHCGSWLTLGDMGTDTATKGCAKCRRKRQSPASVAQDDESPFLPTTPHSPLGSRPFAADSLTRIPSGSTVPDLPQGPRPSPRSCGARPAVGSSQYRLSYMSAAPLVGAAGFAGGAAGAPPAAAGTGAGAAFFSAPAVALGASAGGRSSMLAGRTRTVTPPRTA